MTLIADVSSDHQTMWWITLGLGLVVLSAVILLLGFLVVLVKDIAAGVDEAVEEAGKVAANTAATWMLNETVAGATALRDETRLHAEALAAAAGGQP